MSSYISIPISQSWLETKNNIEKNQKKPTFWALNDTKSSTCILFERTNATRTNQIQVLPYPIPLPFTNVLYVQEVVPILFSKLHYKMSQPWIKFSFVLVNVDWSKIYLNNKTFFCAEGYFYCLMKRIHWESQRFLHEILCIVSWTRLIKKKIRRKIEKKNNHYCILNYSYVFFIFKIIFPLLK